MAANVDIIIRTSGAKEAEAALRGLSIAGVDVGRAMTAIEGELNRAGVSTGLLSTAMRALSSPLGAVAVTLGAVATAAKLGVDAMTENARQVERLMAVSGLGASAADNLADTFELLGSNTDALTNALFKMGGELDKGGDAIRGMGVDLHDAMGNLKTEGQLLLDVRDQISQMGSASERSAALMQLFGRAGRELAPIFAMSREEFGQWLQKGSELSEWTEANQLATKQYERTVKELSLTFDAFAQTIGKMVIPGLQGMMRFIVEIANVDWSKPMFGRFDEEAAKLDKMNRSVRDAGLAFKEGEVNVIGFGEAFAKAAPKVGSEMLGPLLKDFPEFKKGMDDAKKAVDDQKQAIEAWEKAVGQVGIVAALVTDDVEKLRSELEFEGIEETVRAIEEWEKAVGQLGLTAALITDDVEKLRGEMEFEALEESVRAIEDWEKSIGQSGETAAFMTDDVEKLRGAMEFENLEETVRAIDAWEKSVGQAGITAAFVTDDVEKLRSEMEFEELQSGITAIEAWERSIGQVGLTAAIITDDVEKLRGEMEFQDVQDSIKAWDDFGTGIERMFLSVLDTGDKLVTGLIQGTLDIGDAFKDLGLKLIANFVNVVIDMVFAPVLKAAASFVTGLIQMLVSGGPMPTMNLAGTVIGGLFGAGSGMGSGGGVSVPLDAAGFMDFTSGGTASSGGGIGGTISSIASLGSTVYSVVAKMAGLPTVLDLAVSGISAVGSALFGGGPALASVGGALLPEAGTVALTGLVDAATLVGAEAGAAAGASAWLVGASGAAMGPGLIGGGLVMAIPALASFLATMDQAQKIESQVRATQTARVYEAQQFQVGSRITSREQLLTGEPRERLAELGGGALQTLAQDWRAEINQTVRALADQGMQDDGMIASMIATGEARDAKMRAFLSKLGDLGIEPQTAARWDEARGQVGDFTVQMQANVERLVDFWMQIFDRLGIGMEQAASDTGQAVDSLDENVRRYQGELVKLAGIAEMLDIDVTMNDISGLGADVMKMLVDGMRHEIASGIVMDPVKLVGLLDIQALKKDSETLEEAFDGISLALFELGQMMTSIEREALAFKDPLRAATEGFKETIAAVESADWEGMAADLYNADPRDWAAAAAQAHDLLVARYQAELALIDEMVGAINLLGGAANAVVAMGPFLETIGVHVGPMVEQLTAFAGTLPVAETSLAAFGGAVSAFAKLAMMAGQSADPALIASAAASWGNLMDAVVPTMNQILAIEDPNQRLEALVTFMQQLGTAAQSAVAGMMALVEHINMLVASTAQAANTLTEHAALFAQVGVDISAAANDMAKFSMEIPTMVGQLTALNSAVGLGIAAMGTGAGSGAGLDPQVFVDAIVGAVQSAMALMDPGQRIDALSAIMDTIAQILAALPDEQRAAIIDAFGPGIQQIGDAIIAAGTEQAALAMAAAQQLEQIIGDQAVNAENFLLMTVDSINSAMQAILDGAPGAFQFLADSMSGAGEEIGDAIEFAGHALDGALGSFETAASQISSALSGLPDAIGDAVYQAASAALAANAAPPAPGFASGIAFVPKTMHAILHAGERVLTAVENREFSGGVRGGRFLFSPTINVNIGGTNYSGAAIAKMIEEILGRSIRTGRLRRDLQNLQRGIS